MRNPADIEVGLQTIENRIDRDSEYMGEDPLAGLVMSVHQAKRAVLLQVRDSEHGEHWEMYDRLKGALTTEMGLTEFVQVQSMINAHEWAQDEFETL